MTTRRLWRAPWEKLMILVDLLADVALAVQALIVVAMLIDSARQASPRAGY